MTPTIRSLHLRGALGTVRTEQWEGREHLVVPVVALQEAVIHAVNAPAAEFVPASTLIDSVGRWNGHPLVVGHPVKDGKQISAHSPEVLAKHGFGFIRQSSMHGSRLGMEAMVDVARLVALKQDKLLADLRAGNGVEVSVGAFVNTNDRKAEFGGKAYDGEWTSITPDHLAFLPGGVGACSMAMGCGAHRGAMLVTAESFEALENSEGINQYTGAAAGHDTAAKVHMAAAEAHRTDAAKGPRPIGTKSAANTLSIQANRETKNSPTTMASFHAAKAASASLSRSPSTAAFHHEQAAKAHINARDGVGMKGLSMSVKGLKKRILALFDTPEQAASEEAAELIAYQSMRDLLDGAGDQWDAASALVDDLIADEEDDPTETPAQEQAEEEVEMARLDAIRMHCYAMIAALQSIASCCNEQQIEDVQPSDPRYMEAFKALGERLRTGVGKAISAKNMKTIQATHDASHDMHTSTVALGAECSGMKVLAKQQDCAACDGNGTKDGKDCTECGGTGQMKAAEAAKLRAACSCDNPTEAEMKTKAERIAALLANEHNTVKDIKDATSDEVLTLLEAHAEANKKHAGDLKAAQDKQTETDAALKVAQAAQIPAEELASLRSLAAERDVQDKADKAALVEKLVPLKTLSKEQLEAKTLDELRTLAKFAKLEQAPTFVRPAPIARNAEQQDFTPPDAYGLKVLQGVKEEAAK